VQVELNVTDLKNIQRKLIQVAEKLKDGSLITNVALKVERQAMQNAGGGHGTHAGGFPNVQTGRLKSSIVIQVSPDKTEAVVGTNVFYAPDVELGHKQEVGRYVPIYGMRQINAYSIATHKKVWEVSKGLGFRLKNPFARAYPFLRPALDEVRSSGEMEGVFGNFCADIERDWIR
jgi:phage gpG-like protein